MKIVLISDTHMQLEKVSIPDGDLLIHAGDLTYRGSVKEMVQELRTLKKKAKDFKHVIFVCGNHEKQIEGNPTLLRQLCKDYGVTYLQDSWVEIDGKIIYGTPYQPEFCGWGWNLPRNGEQLKRKWAQIPDNTDILVTHSPPYGMLDQAPRDGWGLVAYENVGCELLAERIKHLPNLKLHVFGHIHNGFGRFHSTQYIDGVEQPSTIFVNASICTEEYKPTNRPIVVEL